LGETHGAIFLKAPALGRLIPNIDAPQIERLYDAQSDGIVTMQYLVQYGAIYAMLSCPRSLAAGFLAVRAEHLENFLFF
jgi:hypothetical protein